MQIYILRHAMAVPRGTPGYPNDDRPLTEEGIQKMTDVARGIKEITEGFDVIISSPLIRARDTAKITAEQAGYTKEIVTTEYLLPGSPRRNLLKFLSGYKHNRNILLVGHEPHLGYLASMLIGSNESVIEFKKGAVCRIDIDSMPPVKHGKLIYLLQPKELRIIAQAPIRETVKGNND
jgi:phosphohistidine phosphatase